MVWRVLPVGAHRVDVAILKIASMMSYMYSENEGFYLEIYLCQMQAFERDLHKWMVEPLATHGAQKLGVVLTGAKQPENLFLRIWNFKWSKRLIETFS